jgi:hypothetical protein
VPHIPGGVGDLAIFDKPADELLEASVAGGGGRRGPTTELVGDDVSTCSRVMLPTVVGMRRSTRKAAKIRTASMYDLMCPVTGCGVQSEFERRRHRADPGRRLGRSAGSPPFPSMTAPQPRALTHRLDCTSRISRWWAVCAYCFRVSSG